VSAIRAFRKTKSIASDHNAILQNHTVAEAAEFANDRMGMKNAVFTNGRAFVDHCMRMQGCSAADRDVVADHRECAYGCAFANSRAG